MKTVRARSVARVLCSLLGAMPLGCVDTREAFDDFSRRYAATHPDGGNTGGDAGPCELPAAGAITGRYLLAVAPAFSPKTPILFFADLSAQHAGSELSLGVELTAISASDRRTPVGAPLPRREYRLAEPHVELDLGAIEVAGEADPFIPGAAIRARVALAGSICRSGNEELELLCGSASGSVSEPAQLDLSGSTWAAVRAPSGADLPAIVLNCAKDAPAPL